MDRGTTVCYVQSTGIVNHGEDHHMGTLSLVQVSDVHYIITFVCDSLPKTDIRKNKIYFDLDELEILSDKLSTMFDEDVIDFVVEDKIELSLLLDAIHECREVCELTLRLRSLVRDVYYAGVYNHITDYDNVVLSHEIIAQFGQNATGKPLKVFEMPKPVESQADQKIVVEDIIVTCIYCDAVVTDPDNVREFMIHPYVPFREDINNPNYMCMYCVHNWKDFRDQADVEKQLKLPGEYNEEVCAACSDSPSELIMCCECPRSFCHSCLKRILSITSYDRLLEEDDWKCMLCSAGMTIFDPLPKNQWKVLSGVADILKYTSPQIKGPSSKATPRRERRAVSLNTNSIDQKPTQMASNPKSTEDPSSMTRDTRKKRSRHDGTQNPEVMVDHVAIKSKDDSELERDVSKSSRSKRARNKPDDATIDGYVDELFYFQQYLLYYNKLCVECEDSETVEPSKGKHAHEAISTDEACFLCKDGGTLIECDWVIKGKKNSRCRKVYHNYCLTYEIQDDDQDWYCPRHFCGVCGSFTLSYACLFCPISICHKCPSEMVKKYGQASYVELDRPPTGEFTRMKQIAIACQTCLETIQRIDNEKRISSPEIGLIIKDILKRKVKRFPGEFKENSLVHNGILLKDTEFRPDRIIIKATSTNDDRNLKRKSASQAEELDQTVPVGAVGKRKSISQSYDYNDLYGSHKGTSSRKLKWTYEEDIDLEIAYKRHCTDIDRILSDETLTLRFRHRERHEIIKKLEKLSALEFFGEDDKVSIDAAEGSVSETQCFDMSDRSSRYTNKRLSKNSKEDEDALNTEDPSTLEVKSKTTRQSKKNLQSEEQDMLIDLDLTSEPRPRNSRKKKPSSVGFNKKKGNHSADLDISDSLDPITVDNSMDDETTRSIDIPLGSNDSTEIEVEKSDDLMLDQEMYSKSFDMNSKDRKQTPEEIPSNDLIDGNNLDHSKSEPVPAKNKRRSERLRYSQIIYKVDTFGEDFEENTTLKSKAAERITLLDGKSDIQEELLPDVVREDDENASLVDSMNKMHENDKDHEDIIILEIKTESQVEYKSDLDIEKKARDEPKAEAVDSSSGMIASIGMEDVPMPMDLETTDLTSGTFQEEVMLSDEIFKNQTPMMLSNENTLSVSTEEVQTSQTVDSEIHTAEDSLENKVDGNLETVKKRGRGRPKRSG